MAKFLKLFCFAVGLHAITVAHAQVTYKISPASTVRISGTSTLSDWVVKSQEVSGEMTFAAFPKKKGSEMQTGTIKDAKAVLEVSSIKSEKGEVMDNKMYSALKNDTHPQIIFSLISPIQVERAPAKLSTTGNVQLAGVTRPMTFILDITYDDNTFHLTGSQSLKLSDFEIEPPTAMFGQIETGDEIKIAVDLSFKESK